MLRVELGEQIKGLLEPAHSYNGQFALCPTFKLLVPLSPVNLNHRSIILSTCMIKSRFSSRDRKFQSVNLVPRISYLPAPWSKRSKQERGGKMRDPGTEVARRWANTGHEEQRSDSPLWRLGILLLLHCHEHCNITNHSEIISVNRNFWKIKGQLWHWELLDGFN